MIGFRVESFEILGGRKRHRWVSLSNEDMGVSAISVIRLQYPWDAMSVGDELSVSALRASTQTLRGLVSRRHKRHEERYTVSLEYGENPSRDRTIITRIA